MSDNAKLERDIPVCVDLDGTLIHTDLLLESLISVFRQRWTDLLKIPFWLFRGKAYLKARLADRATLDARYLPYNDALIDYLREQKQLGRRVVLATASNERLAQAVSEHTQLFDEVIASDSELNQKGEIKARSLVARFGDKGFDYAGNDSSDLAIWKHARSAIVADVSSVLRRKVEKISPIEEEFQTRQSRLKCLLKAMRCYQWVKNFLVFIPVVTGLKLLDATILLPTVIMFAGFCMAASGTYLLNDLMDLEADRKHPRKRNRPFASGALPLTYAPLGPGLIVLGALTGFLVSSACGLLIVLYAVLSTTYSVYLKSQPLVDVFTLAALYTLRILGGGLASQLGVSIWILSFSGFLFLSLAFLKRTAEFIQSESELSPQVSRRGYTASDVGVIQVMGLASSFTSCLVLALYMDSMTVKSQYQNPLLLWGMVPLFLFWQCRLWLSTARGYMDDDPIVYTAKDHVSWLIFGLVAVIYMAAIVGIEV